MGSTRLLGACALLVLGSLAAGCGSSSRGGGAGPFASAATTAGATSGTTAAGATTTSGTTTSAGSTPSGATTQPGQVPAPSGPRYRVSGWLPYWAYATGDDTLRQNVGNGLDEVNLFGYALQSDGSLTAHAGVESATRHQLVRDRQGELIPTILDVHSSAVLPAVMDDPARRARTIQAVLDLLDRFGYDGVDVDFEHATTARKDDFTRFMADMSQAVRARGKVFSLTIPGKRAGSQSWGGYDYPALAPLADRVKIMTYGYSGPWSRTPGPIAPVTWIRQVMDYAVTTMPAGKIQIGIPFYGYDWPLNQTDPIRSVTWNTAQPRLARSAAGMRFDATRGETTFDYRDEQGVDHTVWFQDDRAIAAKCDVVRQYGAGGLSIWALGNESPTYWTEIRRILK